MDKKNYKIIISGTSTFKLEYSVFTINNNSDYFLYLHGFPGAPLHEASYIPKLLADRNYNTIAFNYPGMWTKNGTFSAKDLINGILGLLNDLVLQLQLPSLNLFGESFGGAVALNIIGRGNSPIPIKKVVLRSPLLTIEPFLSILPITVPYLTQAKILNVKNTQQVLQDVKVFDPMQFYEKIAHMDNIKIWGVIGKNDDVLPAKQMLEAINKYPSINVELWDDFPHNDIDDILYHKFFTKLQEFMNT